MSQAAAAPPPQPVGSAPPLPGYYTAYLAQQQQHPPPQLTPAGPAAPYPYPSTQPSYAYYPVAGPASYPPAAAPPAAAVPPPASAPSTAPTSGAATAPADAAAAYAKYQEDYARWYNQYYAPYAAYLAQHPHAAVPQPHPQHPPPAAAAYPLPYGAPANQQPPAAVQPQPTANLAQHGYPHPPASFQAQQSQPHTLAQQFPPPTSHQQSTSSPHAPLTADSSKRSRWGGPDESTVQHQHAPAYHPARPTSSAAVAPAPSSSSSSVVWPPSVIEYVKRSLAQCPAGQRVEVEVWMRERLQAAVNNGSMQTTDWEREPPAHVRKLAEQLTKRYSGAAAAPASHAPPAANHETIERRNVDEERREWEERRRREEEEEAGRRKQPHFHNDKLFPPRDMKKRLREDDEKSFTRNQSSSDDEDDIQHFLTSSYNNKQLSKREQRKQKKKAKQLQQAKANGAGGKSGIWQVDHVDVEKNQDRANRFADYVQQAAATPMRTRIRTDLFTFSGNSSSSAAYGGGVEEDGDIDWSALKIVGTSTSLEKSYFRLTSPPSPSVVRPPPILSAALERLLSLHAAGERNYAYLCDQMKAIRQDLTVQGVNGEVAVRVYEEHAKMAIEVGDMSEYNQCQTQLMVLYAEKPSRKRGESTNDTVTDVVLVEEKEMSARGDSESSVWVNETEFLMYRLCYYLLVNNQPAIASYLRSLTPHQRTLPAIRHVLDLRSAVACDDFHTFLSRYNATPYMGATLLHHLCPRLRWLGVQVLVRGYKPTRVEVDVFTRALSFTDVKQSVHFLASCGAALSGDKQFVLTANSDLHEPEAEEDEDSEAEKHNVTHALLSSIRKKQ